MRVFLFVSCGPSWAAPEDEGLQRLCQTAHAAEDFIYTMLFNALRTG
jgi:hypothetical protein